MAAKPSKIELSSKTYYNASDIKKYDPAYFVGTSRTIRNIIKKKVISVDNYLFASHSKKYGWRPVANQEKPPTKAKLLLLASWVENNVPKMKDADETETPQYEYPIVPELLTLHDDEKFQDENGKCVEIEARGTRSADGIYFLAGDISIAFEIPGLLQTLRNTNEYIKGEEYNIFLCKNENNIYKKRVYLTYEGMRKVINRSDSIRLNEVKKNANNWLNQFWINDGNFLINIKKNTKIKRQGVVYCVTSEGVNFIKIGYWTSSIQSLRKRYTTCYGKNLIIQYVETANAVKLEKMCHKKFQKENIVNELFIKEKLSHYMEYLELNKEPIENIEETQIGPSQKINIAKTPVAKHHEEFMNKILLNLTNQLDNTKKEMEKLKLVHNTEMLSQQCETQKIVSECKAEFLKKEAQLKAEMKQMECETQKKEAQLKAEMKQMECETQKKEAQLKAEIKNRDMQLNSLLREIELREENMKLKLQLMEQKLRNNIE